MKKIFLIIGIFIIVAGSAVLILRFFSGDEDVWLCQNGEWIKHGNPVKPMPSEGCGGQNEQKEIIVDLPTVNSEISSSLEISGKARGNWYFEAVFPIRLLDGTGKEIARAQAQAQSDWMTIDFVPFKAVLEFETPATATGTLIFENDNPSGLPEKAKSFSLPVVFSK